MRAACLKALLGILLIISVFAQGACAQSFAQWVARALDAESRREYDAAQEAYHHALELRPLDVVLNIKLYSSGTGDHTYLLRAAEGLLQEPHPQHELVEQICDLLMNRPYFVEYNAPLPLTLLPAEKRKAFIQRFAKWLFPDLITEARYYLITNEREKAVSIMHRIALCGEPFALDELLWGPPAKRDDWRRQIAEEWEREALKTKHPCLLVAVLNMYWHLQDLPSIRRVFPHALAATQRDRRYRQLLAICMHRIGWKEGMAKVPLQQEEASDDPSVLERQLMEATRRGQTDRARRLFLRYWAEVPGWAQSSLFYHAGFDLLGEDHAEASVDERNIEKMLVRYLQQPEGFRYWLKVAVVRGTRLIPLGTTPTDVLVCNFLDKIPPDYVVAVIDKALPLLDEMGLPEPLLKSQTEFLQQHRIDAYSRLGYDRLVRKLRQRTTGGFSTESGWGVTPAGWGQTVKREQPEMVDTVFVHAPKAFRPALQRTKIALRANPPDALPLDVQVEILTELVLKQPMPAREKIEDLRTVAFTNPEAVTTVLERLLPDLMINDPDSLYGNNLLWGYCRMLSDIAERKPQLASRLHRLFEKAVAQDDSLRYSMAYERASLASLAGKKEQALHCLLQASSVETPGVVSGASLLFHGMVKIPLSPEGYHHLQEALQDWLRREVPSLTRITEMLRDIPSYGVARVYTGGRKTYYGTASETGLRMLAETLIDYVQRFPGVIPKSFTETVIAHARHVYSRDDIAGAAPAWKQLMHASLRDIILLSPDDAREVAENLRFSYLSSSAHDISEAFRKDITEIIGLLQSGGERS
ncbi:MAG: hypothetical protein ACP5RN_07800 [Armatimonadota bacterium]